MKHAITVIILMIAGIYIYSCNKSALNQPATGVLSEAELANKKGVEGLLIGAYSVLNGMSVNQVSFYGGTASNWIYGSVCGSEAYTGGESVKDQPDMISLELFTATSINEDLSEKWVTVYDGVERTNAVLRVMRKASDMTTADTTEIRAEALFLRALFHFEAKKIWNSIPHVDETILFGAGNYFVPNDTSWSMIENDLTYAMEHLPVTQDAVGRCNKYAAEALLAKALMFEHKFPEAKTLLTDLINNGKTSGGLSYDLVNYADNFNPVKKNGPESVFAVQMSVDDGSAGSNGNTGDRLNFPTLVGYGFFQPSQYLVNHFKTDSTGLPDLDAFNNNPVTNDEGLLSADSSFTPYTGWLDPRIDWTVGRRGIPYLDWGVHPGNDWIRSNQWAGPYSPIKNVFYMANLHQYTNADNSIWGNSTVTANNINLIRFADVLLWAAEAEVESGSLDKAEEYVNRIRNRMADHHEGWVHQYLDSQHPENGSYSDDAHLAANYSISPYPSGYFSSKSKDIARRAVQYERMLELGMEGHRFFDLVRWGIAGQEINFYLKKEMLLRTYLIGAKFKTEKSEYFPIPLSEIDKSGGKLKQNPGY